MNNPRTTAAVAAALSATVALCLAAAPSASAVPRDPNAVVLTQNDCTAGTDTIVTLHPGAGKALWDLTTGSTAPSYLVKNITLDIYRNGEFQRTDTFEFGNKVGLDDVFTCSFYESFTTPDGALVEIFGSGEKVRL